MNDWVKPPLENWQNKLWIVMFEPHFHDFIDYYKAATRPNNPNSLSIERMEKFTQACVIAKLKGEHLK